MLSGLPALNCDHAVRMLGVARRDVPAKDIDVSDVAQRPGGVHCGADQCSAFAKAARQAGPVSSAGGILELRRRMRGLATGGFSYMTVCELRIGGARDMKDRFLGRGGPGWRVNAHKSRFRARECHDHRRGPQRGGTSTGPSRPGLWPGGVAMGTGPLFPICGRLGTRIGVPMLGPWGLGLTVGTGPFVAVVGKGGTRIGTSCGVPRDGGMAIGPWFPPPCSGS